MRTVSVKFKVDSSRCYYYKSLVHVSAGDKVVLADISGALEIGMIFESSVDPSQVDGIAGYVVQRIDMTDYLKALDIDQRIESLKEEIRQILKRSEGCQSFAELDNYVRELKELSLGNDN